MSIATLADAMHAAFISKTRDNGDTFYCLAPDSPEWMFDACYAGHGEMLPDDFRYAIIREAVGFISDRGEDFDVDGDDSAEFADGVDVYHSGLLAWVASNLHRMAYVDEALEGYGFKELGRALMAGQSLERREIFDAVVQALQERADNDDDSQD